MNYQIKIPKTPLKLKEVKPGLWVALKDKDTKYYDFFETLKIYKKV